MKTENDVSGILVKTFFYKSLDKIFADIYQCGNSFFIVSNGKVVGQYSKLEDAEIDVRKQLNEGGLNENN
jgi:pyoverdine/dityrosine biosynthesis protein Dit1